MAAKTGWHRSEVKMDAKPRRERHLEAVAYHEAGHVVALFAQGRKIRTVDIVNDDVRREGTVQNTASDNEQLDKITGSYCAMTVARKALAESEIVMLFSGTRAEEKLRDHKPRKWGGQPELYHAKDIAKRLTYTQTDFICGRDRSEKHRELCKRLWGKSKELVTSNWTAIDAIAKALLQKKSLSHDEAYEIWQNVYKQRNLCSNIFRIQESLLVT